MLCIEQDEGAARRKAIGTVWELVWDHADWADADIVLI